MDLVSQNKIVPDELTESQIYIRNNDVKTHESYLNIGVFGLIHLFYDISKVVQKTMQLDYLNGNGL